jgi:hypothetical protein
VANYEDEMPVRHGMFDVNKVRSIKVRTMVDSGKHVENTAGWTGYAGV